MPLKNVQLRTVVSFLTIAVVLTTAATPPIGLAIANGDFRLDKQSVPGNATVFDGNTIETLENTSRVSLQTGTRIELAESSRGVFHRDYLKLEKGMTQVETSRAYQIQALSLKIVPAEGTASARVSITGSESVRVASLSGTVRVSNREGVLVASLFAGRSLDFSPQAEAGAAAPTKISGCLTKSDGRYLLKDETANITTELRGDDLASRVGSQVEILGTMKAAEGASVVDVLRVNLLSQSCWGDRPVATSPEKASILGMTRGHAVIAGVGIAAAAAIPAIVLNGDSPPKTLSPSSR